MRISRLKRSDCRTSEKTDSKLLFKNTRKARSAPFVAYTERRETLKYETYKKLAPAALGTDTETAVQSGLVIGAAVQAEGLVARIKAELDIEDAPVIGTGGLARTVSGATDLFDFIDPDLTLRGIYEMSLRA